MDSNNSITDNLLRRYENAEDHKREEAVVTALYGIEAKLAAARATLEEISRDAWSGDKARMNAIARAADKALAESDPGKE